MARHIAAGIDIGTHQVKVVIAELLREKNRATPKILGTGIVESKGLRNGYIVNASDVTRSIKQALAQAERTAEVKLKRAYLSIGGISLDEFFSSGDAVVSRGDSEVTELDVEKALSQSEKTIPRQVLLNRKVIHSIPLSFRIDGEQVLGSRPVGMKGMKLEVKTLFITCLSQHLNDLVEATEAAGIEVEDVMASPIAASFVTLTKAQKKAGVVLANIGAETTTIVVYENGVPISLKVFPMGGADITNDIALGLRVPMEEAEQIKLGAFTSTTFSKKRFDDLIASRLGEIFDLIGEHLKKIGKHELLPAGILLIGGSSLPSSTPEIARSTLKLPARAAVLQLPPLGKSPLKDANWAVAYGLTVWGLNSEEEEGGGIKIAKRTGGTILSWLQQFLP